MNKKEELLQEIKLRRLIRKALKIKQAKNNVLQEHKLEEEQKLRQVIRHVLREGDVDSDTNPAPYASTALSALADAFNQILPVLKTGLRKLSKPEERRSYRAHVLQKFVSMFKNFEGLDSKQVSGAIGESGIEEDLNVKIDNRPDDAMVVPDIEKERFKPEEKPDLEPDDADVENLAISTEDPTGARFAFSTINNSNIEKLLGDNRKLLPNDEYKKQYKEYGLYNIDLWLNTYEKELADELGTAPAFNNTVIKKPAGAEISGTAAEFEGAPEDVSAAVAPSGDEADIPDLDVETDDLVSDLEKILMMEQ